MMTDDTAPQTANLARIRDNQRRSRARRKAYLSELETKYRSCEQTGISASAEIQAAARRVVDENKRLRTLLRRYGLTDADIDAQQRELDPSVPMADFEAPTALERMLRAPRRCGSENREREVTTSPAAASALEYQQPPRALPLLAPTNMPTQPSITANPTNDSGPAPQHPITPIFDAQHAKPETSLATDVANWPVYGEPLDAAATACLGSTSSCQDAADIIRMMEPHLGPEVVRELGCVEGVECYPPPTIERVLEVLDRASMRQGV